MENYFNKYNANKVDSYNGYTDTTWYYQDPMYAQTQNMEYVLQEMPPAVERGRNNNRGNNNSNRGNNNSNRPGNNRPDNREENWQNNPPGNWGDSGGNRDNRWDNNRGNNQGGWEDMRGGTPPNMGATPMAPPPSRVPARNASMLRVDAGSIRNCMRRLTYIWQSNGMEYWMIPLNISPTTLSVFRWDGRRGWIFGGVSLNRIDSFTCI
jgi:hypothetical protein